MTVWLNVSFTAQWVGPVVGIARTERRIAEELNETLKDQLQLCVWRNDEFVSFDKNSYFYPGIFTAPNQEKLTLTKWQKRRKKWKHSIAKRVKKIGLDKILSQRTLTVPPKVNKPSEKFSSAFVIFKAHDTLVTCGNDWDQLFHDQLYFVKKYLHLNIITCAYDLIPVLFPQCCCADTIKRFSEYFIDLLWGSDVVLCISKSTEQDLKLFAQNQVTPLPYTKVIRLGGDIISNVSERSKRNISQKVEQIADKPFILYVSTIERRKNHETLYKAYHILAEKGFLKDMPNLVFAGMLGWGYSDLVNDINFDPLTKDKIILAGRVNDQELDYLYSKCLFTVFPSKYEGYGLGVAESLIHKKFVLASNAGSLPEVGGDFAEYLDPWDTLGWASRLYYWSTHTLELAKKQEFIISHYQPSTWHDCSVDVLEAIDLLQRGQK